jgi:hypothetical protein
VDSKIGWEMIVPRFLGSPFGFLPTELDFSSAVVVFVVDLVRWFCEWPRVDSDAGGFSVDPMLDRLNEIFLGKCSA